MTQPTVRQALIDTLADASAAGLTDQDDRAALLPILLQAHLGTSRSGHSQKETMSGQDDGRPADIDSTSGAASPDSLLGRISAATKLEIDDLETVYSERDGILELVLPARRLANDMANATRQLAQIYGLGRQLAGLEEWTTFVSVREVVASYGKLDSKNFASHVAKLDDVSSIRGKSPNKEFKIHRTGREKVLELLQAMVRD